MTARERQQALLAALAVLVVVLVWRQLPSIGSSLAGSRAAPVDGGLVAGHLLPLAVDRLDRDAETYEPGRNIFRQGERPKPPPPSRPEPPKPKPEPKPRAEPPEPAKPQPPKYDHLDLLGIFGPEERRIAVLVDGDVLHNVLVGDVLEDRFVIEAILWDEVELGYVDFPDAPPGRLQISGS